MILVKTQLLSTFVAGGRAKVGVALGGNFAGAATDFLSSTDLEALITTSLDLAG